jgi:hypothetical protein
MAFGADAGGVLSVEEILALRTLCGCVVGTYVLVYDRGGCSFHYSNVNVRHDDTYIVFPHVQDVYPAAIYSRVKAFRSCPSFRKSDTNVGWKSKDKS